MASERGGAWWLRTFVVVCALFTMFGLLSACGGPDAGGGSQASDPCAALTSKSTVSPGQAGHLVYQRILAGPVSSQATLRPDQPVTFVWCAVPAQPTQDVGDAQEALTLALAGPYATRADAQAAQGQSVAQVTTIATAPVITTDTWSATRYSSTVTLPPTAISGYYVVFANVTLGNATGQGTNGVTSGSSAQTEIIQVAD